MIGKRYINIDGYIVDWDAHNRKIFIKPTNGEGDFTFGLGNAVVTVDVSNPPKELIKKIDSDPDFDIERLSIPVDYSTSHLVQAATNMTKKEISIKLSDNRVKRIEMYVGDIEHWQKSTGYCVVSGMHVTRGGGGVRLFR